MTWLCILFMGLAFCQAKIMRRLGMIWHIRDVAIPATPFYDVWGIFWVGTALQVSERLTYWNLVILFSVCFPFILWGHMPPRETLGQRLSRLKKDLTTLSDGIANGRFINICR